MGLKPEKLINGSIEGKTAVSGEIQAKLPSQARASPGIKVIIKVNKSYLLKLLQFSKGAQTLGEDLDPPVVLLPLCRAWAGTPLL